MRRAVGTLLALFAVAGCSRLETADSACSDCIPPNIAGRVFYHRDIDKLVTKFTARRCAKRDIDGIDCNCDFDLSCDFRQGFTQAYVDLSLGRPPCVPAMPPKKYWHAYYRSCAGRDAVEEWYAGYRLGLDSGMNGGVSQFNRVVMNRDASCVSAAYVNPYAVPMTPGGNLPANGQTIPELAEGELDETDAQSGTAIPAGAIQPE